jgi:UDP-GlcNAc:undecaprenyl-phosphate GlcNAc-1-phosphate transferase
MKITLLEGVSIIKCGILAFVFSCLAVPLFRRIGVNFGAVSAVGGRNVGSVPISRFGGVGICFSIAVSLGVLIGFDQKIRGFVYEDRFRFIGIIGGWLLVAVIGAIDDLVRIRAKNKFFVQILAAVVAFGSGLKLDVVDFPYLGELRLGAVALPVTIIWIVTVINAFNLIDGLDGLAAGVTINAAIVGVLAAYCYNSPVAAFVLAAIIGSVGGFCIFNWYPAKVYMGDSGAYSLGFLLAVCALMSPIQKVSTSVSIIVPCLAIGLPLFDAITTVFRRILKGRGIFSPDREHLHHILLDSGIAHERVVVGLYLLSWVWCSIAVVIVLKRQYIVGEVMACIAILGVFLWGRGVRSQLSKVLSSLCRSFSLRKRR